jgi:biopolymer transport protein ExbB
MATITGITTMDRPETSAVMFRTILRSGVAAAILSLATAAFAQQGAAPAAQPVPYVRQQAAQPAPALASPAAQAQAAPAPQSPVAAPSTAETSPLPADAASPPAAKPVMLQVPRELSPWSMFLSADIIVKAVMIGLAFASLVTWTIFIAKTFELSIARQKLKSSLRKVEDARSLAEAQMALGKKTGVLSAFVAAALHEARLSAGIASDSGIKERATLSFAEIQRAAARRIRFGMGLLATIGATSPFVGLFGTVWGIMNSFIGISKSQTTNLAVVAPGIAEALLATAIGLVAAIPAVIIYNHFARQTKTYLELVSRASGAAARLLSRDLDRAGGVMHSRAAE